MMTFYDSIFVPEYCYKHDRTGAAITAYIRSYGGAHSRSMPLIDELTESGCSSVGTAGKLTIFVKKSG
jgi:hypothetical protein